ncbi:MAG: hypothetical protein LBF50_01380 [Azoarcus sp.]|jgi:hypothetical protein|nr:hypothetical protein [Azoarcus sp.]
MKSNCHNTGILAQVGVELGEIEALLLPCTHTLSAKERQKLPKMGDKIAGGQ